MNTGYLFTASSAAKGNGGLEPHNSLDTALPGQKDKNLSELHPFERVQDATLDAYPCFILVAPDGDWLLAIRKDGHCCEWRVLHIGGTQVDAHNPEPPSLLELKGSGRFRLAPRGCKMISCGFQRKRGFRKDSCRGANKVQKGMTTLPE